MCTAYPGPLATYNSLTDEHLGEYFSNPRRLSHLRRMGLITRDGQIVDEGVARMKMARKEHEIRSKELLAGSVVNRAIELERKRRAELKQKLELLAKYEIVERVKSQKQNPFGVQSFNPYYTAPHPPLRLSTSMDKHADKLRLSHDQLSNMKQLVGTINRGRTIRTPSSPMSPYAALSASKTPTPIPRPPSAPKPKSTFTKRRSTVKNRPNTAPSSYRSQPTLTGRQVVHSDARVTLCFVGRSLHLEGSAGNSMADVLVLQQHCGGNTVTLFKGKVRSREHFTFASRRHLDMTFGLAIYLDGMIDLRISACCEYRHRCGMLLGSRSSHFRLVEVKGGKPCLRCESEKSKRLVREAFKPLNLEQTLQTEDVSLGDLLRDHLDHEQSQPGGDNNTHPHSTTQPLQSSSELMTSTAHQQPYEDDTAEKTSDGIESYLDDFSRSSSPAPPEVEDIEVDESPVGSASRLQSHSPGLVNEGGPIAPLQLGSDNDRRSSAGSVHSHLSGNSQLDEVIVSRTSSKSSVHSQASYHRQSSGNSSLVVPDVHSGIEAEDSEATFSDEAVTGPGEQGSNATVGGDSPGSSDQKGPLTEEVHNENSSDEPPDVDDNAKPSETDSDLKEDNNVLDSTSSTSDLPQELDILQQPGPTSSDAKEENETAESTLTRKPSILLDSDKSKSSHSLCVSLDATVTEQRDNLDESLSSNNRLKESSSAVGSLSANVTLADTATMLKKTPSSDSLGSVPNDKSLEDDSSVELSESEDEDLPKLERNISEINESEAGSTDADFTNNDEATDVMERPPARMSQYSHSAEELMQDLTPVASNELLTDNHTELKDTEERTRDLTVAENVISDAVLSDVLPESGDISNHSPLNAKQPSQVGVSASSDGNQEVDETTADSNTEHESHHNENKRNENSESFTSVSVSSLTSVTSGSN